MVAVILVVTALLASCGASDSTQDVSSGAGGAFEQPSIAPDVLTMDAIEADLATREPSDRVQFALPAPEIFTSVEPGDGSYVWTSPKIPTELIAGGAAIAYDVVLIDGTADRVAHAITRTSRVDGGKNTVIEVTATVDAAEGNRAALVVPYFEIQDPNE